MPAAIIAAAVGIYVVAGVTYALIKISDFGDRVKKLEDEVIK